MRQTAGPHGRGWYAHDRTRHFFARLLWSFTSLVVVCASGVGTGLRWLDRSAAAPWARSGILLVGLILLATLARAVSTSLATRVELDEARTGPPLRKNAIGPSRRWAIWISSASIACMTSYLLNEHRPARLGLVPARALDVLVVAAGSTLLTPYILDVYRGRRPRRWPLSPPKHVHYQVREDDDVVGAISRMSPPLLFAMFLAFFMFIAIYIVGIHDPSKLLGGLGVLGLFCAGLLAAPTLLHAQAEEIEPVWRARWYDKQRDAVAGLRPAIVTTHRIVIATQVALTGGALGVITSGSGWVSTFTKMVTIALVLGLAGFVFARTLWLWAPDHSDEGPICTDVLIPRTEKLTRLAGWALACGSLCSLAAVLIS
jgi:hypothetical protein